MHSVFVKLCSVGVFALLFWGASPVVAHASAIYTFQLQDNGDISDLTIELTFPDLLAPGGLISIPLTDARVTDLSFPMPGFDPINSVVALQVTATQTLVGITLVSSSDLLLITDNYPGDFFVFPRLPSATGTFVSLPGTVDSELELDDRFPTGSLTVTSVTSDVAPVPEPTSLLLFGSGAVGVLARMRRRKQQ